MSEADDVSKLVNASGFAFQLGIEHAVRQKRGHSWRVVSREHPWALGEAGGFIDLVLGLGLVTGVVECKRTRGGAWVFLVPDGEERQRSVSRVLWVADFTRQSLLHFVLMASCPGEWGARFLGLSREPQQLNVHVHVWSTEEAQAACSASFWLTTERIPEHVNVAIVPFSECPHLMFDCTANRSARP